MKKDRPFNSITRTATGRVFWCLWRSKPIWREAVEMTLTPPTVPMVPLAEGTAEQLGIGQRAMRHRIGEALMATEKGSPRFAVILWEARQLRAERDAGTVLDADWETRRTALLTQAAAQLIKDTEDIAIP